MSGDKPDWLPPAVVVTDVSDWPAVWQIGYADAVAMDAGLSWVFDVRVQYTNGGGYCTTWAIGGAFRDQPDEALKLLRKRARDWGFERVFIYSARPPLEKELREYLGRYNASLS